jgi:hypothetical protein
MKRFLIPLLLLAGLLLPASARGQGGQAQPIRFGTTLPTCNSATKNQFFLLTTKTLNWCNGTGWVVIGAGPVDVQNATVGYTLPLADNQGYLEMSNSSAMTITLPQPGTSGFSQNFWVYVKNVGPAQLSLSPSSSTLNGSGSNIPIGAGASGLVFSDGTNWHFAPNLPPIGHLYFPFAGCVGGGNTTTGAASAFDLPASLPAVAACKTDGTNNTVQGVLQYADSSVAYNSLVLPSDFVSFSTAYLTLTTSDTTNGHTIIPTLAVACVQPGNNLADTPAYNSVQNFTTITIGASALANATYSTTLTAVTSTGCAAGYVLHIKLSRATDTDTDTSVAYTGGLQLSYNKSYNTTY